MLQITLNSGSLKALADFMSEHGLDSGAWPWMSILVDEQGNMVLSYEMVSVRYNAYGERV